MGVGNPPGHIPVMRSSWNRNASIPFMVHTRPADSSRLQVSERLVRMSDQRPIRTRTERFDLSIEPSGDILNKSAS